MRTTAPMLLAIILAAVPATAGEWWIPATAHADGAQGSVWRTDLVVHNFGADDETASAAGALRSAIADYESAATPTAAETGHLVFGTLHTNSAQGTVNRIIDAFPGNLQDQIRTQLASTLIGVVAQTLLPKIGGGRLAAYEVLVVTPGVSNLIRENKTFRINSAMQTGAKFGMQLMDDALFNHWKNETVTLSLSALSSRMFLPFCV